MCAGALRKYLIAHNELPSKPLKAMVPVSTRKSGDSESANAVSFITAGTEESCGHPRCQGRANPNAQESRHRVIGKPTSSSQKAHRQNHTQRRSHGCFLLGCGHCCFHQRSEDLEITSCGQPSGAHWPDLATPGLANAQPHGQSELVKDYIALFTSVDG